MRIPYAGQLAVARDILTRVDRHVCCVDRQLYAVSGTPPRSRVCRSIQYSTVSYNTVRISVLVLSIRLCDRRVRLQLGCTAWGKQCICG